MRSDPTARGPRPAVEVGADDVVGVVQFKHGRRGAFTFELPVLQGMSDLASTVASADDPPEESGRAGATSYGRRQHQPGICLHEHAMFACRSCCALLASISVDLFDESIRPRLREYHIGDALRFGRGACATGCGRW